MNELIRWRSPNGLPYTTPQARSARAWLKEHYPGFENSALIDDLEDGEIVDASVRKLRSECDITWDIAIARGWF